MKADLYLVPIKGHGLRWAQKAVMNEETRYRGFVYRKDALNNFDEWVEINSSGMFERDFYHNFHTAEELGIVEAKR